jgi:hypothetical protein
MIAELYRERLAEMRKITFSKALNPAFSWQRSAAGTVPLTGLNAMTAVITTSFHVRQSLVRPAGIS